MSVRLFVCLWVAGASFAPAYVWRRTKSLGTLEIGGVKLEGQWEANYPTLKTSDGKYLAYDVSGESPRVFVTDKKGPNTNWAFVGLKEFTKDEGGGYDSGEKLWISSWVKSVSLKLEAREGAYRGWSLARKDGKLVLVKDPAGATTVWLEVKRITEAGK